MLFQHEPMRSCASQGGVGWTWWSNHPIPPIPTRPSLLFPAIVSEAAVIVSLKAIASHLPSSHSTNSPLISRHSGLRRTLYHVVGCLSLLMQLRDWTEEGLYIMCICIRFWDVCSSWRLDGGGRVSCAAVACLPGDWTREGCVCLGCLTSRICGLVQ